MALRMMRGLLVAACLALAACTTWAPPAAYPEFEYVDAKPLVVVADVRPGDFLPEFEQCKRRDVICLHDPLWLKVRVRETLYGQAPASRFVVTTTSHYGFLAYEDSIAPRLMLLMIGPRGDVGMPTYAERALIRRDDGAWFLPADTDKPAWFLPCSIAALRESIDPARFPAPRDDEAVVRHGIPVALIRETLQRERPAPLEMECAWTEEEAETEA